VDGLTELREHALRMAAELPGALRRVSVRSGDTTIEIEWQPQQEHDAVVVTSAATAATAAEPVSTVVDEGTVVRSPMVGTFYRSSSPDAAPYVEVGDVVAAGQTVAIVEAMKLFNPIAVESAGVVVEVLVEDGQPVEFDQPLFRLAEHGAGE
jgi:acetyl-CoA carboxylase biotin carboxyl carrier protein